MNDRILSSISWIPSKHLDILMRIFLVKTWENFGFSIEKIKRNAKGSTDVRAENRREYS